MYICVHEGCNKRPNFNTPGSSKGLYCSDHKKDGMVDVKNKRCEHEGCDKQPVFNLLGSSKGLYCAIHKMDGMVNVKDRRCEHEGCDKVNPVFNTPGSSIGLYCASHKLDGMVNVKDRRCEHEGCEKRPHFNTPGSSIGLYCADHKLDGMVNVKSKRCEYEGCDKITPSFNTPGSSIGLYCSIHKLDGMVDVKSKRCVHEGCETRPIFGFPGISASRCKQHIEDGMIAYPKTKCSYEKCKSPALFGVGRPERCEEHKEPFHLNLVERRCVSCGLLYILNKKSFCGICDPDEFNKTRLAKQNQIKNMLDVNGYKYESCDRMIEHGICFSYRPDFVFDCGTHFVVLEVDEGQHRGYDSKCEDIRMINIYQSLGLTTKFIRYNPDAYKIGKNKKEPSFHHKTKTLKKTLDCAFGETPVAPISVKYMFYDDRENTVFEKVCMKNFNL